MCNRVYVSDKVSACFDRGDNEPDFITIEDKTDHVFIDVAEWEGLKQVVDKLIADNKDG